MQKQGLLHLVGRFPPEHVVIGASHAETGTFIGTGPAAKSNLAHGHIRLAFFYSSGRQNASFFVPCSHILSPYLGITSPILAQGEGCRTVPPTFVA